MGMEREGGGIVRRKGVMGERNGGARTLMTTDAHADWPRKRAVWRRKDPSRGKRDVAWSRFLWIYLASNSSPVPINYSGCSDLLAVLGRFQPRNL